MRLPLLSGALLALLLAPGCRNPQPEISIPPSESPRFSRAPLSTDATPRPTPTPTPTPSPTPTPTPTAPPPVVTPEATAVIESSSAPPRFPISAGHSDGTDFETSRQLAPGVEQFFESRATGPLTISSMVIDPSVQDLRFEVLKGTSTIAGRKTVSTIVEEATRPDDRIIAALNGDFFDGEGRPVGMHVGDEMIWRHPHTARTGNVRSIFAFSAAGETFIGQPDFTMALRDDESGAWLNIDKVNFHEGSSYAVVYTAPFGEEAAPLRDNQVQIVLDLPSQRWLPNEPQTVTVSRVDQGPPAALGTSTLVIHADAPIPSFIEEGATLTIEAKLNNVDWVVTGVVGGLPRLVEKGVADPVRFAAEEGTNERFVTDRHPRTAVGVRENGEVVWVVVDGRQGNRSVGIDLPDLAQYMLDQGCIDAVNLDGGGSSTMWASGEVSNFPSDAGGARAVGNALVLRRTSPLGAASSLQVIPSDVTIPIGAMVDLFAVPVDENGEPVGEPVSAVYTSSEPGVEVLDSSAGRVALRQPGNWIVNARAADGTITGQARLRGDLPETVRFEPARVLMEIGDSVEMNLEAKRPDGGGFYARFIPTVLQIPENLSYSGGSTLTGTREGVGSVVAYIGQREARMDIAVGIRDEAIAHAFDAIPPTDFITGTNYDAERTALRLNVVETREGAAAWSLEYQLTEGGTSRVALPLDVLMPGDPIEIGLHVRGDGQGHWLRGEIEDSRGDRYYVDFTAATPGIDWRDEWRFLRTPLREAKSLRAEAAGPVAPITMKSVYIVQTQEARKGSGTITFDGLCALDIPAL